MNPSSSMLSSKDENILYWGLAFTGFWINVGLFFDGWAHAHGRVDDSFFTPYHAVMYSGLAAAMALVLFYIVKAVREGVSWRRALPWAYQLSFIGGILFFAGGVFDLLWHTLFGIEVNVEALYSPPHLMLAIGGMLIGNAPFRAALKKRELLKLDFFKDFGALLAFTGFMATILFFTQIAHPIARLWGGIEIENGIPNPDWLFREMGVISILLVIVILTAGMYLLISRWSLPIGVFTLYIGLTSVGMGFLYSMRPFAWPQVLAFISSGIAIDLLYRVLQPSLIRKHAFRQFMVVAPMILTTFYFISLFFTSGIWWSVHFWTGTIIVSGLTGLLMSYVFVLPEPSYESASRRRN